MTHSVMESPVCKQTGIIFQASGLFPLAGIKGRETLHIPLRVHSRPVQSKINKVEALKEIIRAWGLNPEKILTREALTEPHKTVIDFQERGNSQLEILSRALRDLIRKETAVQIRSVEGGPDGN